jgi:hypothetical protein
MLLKYVTTWKLRLNSHKTYIIIFSKGSPPLPGPIQIQDAFVPWASAICSLGFVLDSKHLCTCHLNIIANRATSVFCNIFPLLAQDWVLTLTNKLTHYKLLIQSILTDAASVWNSTCSSNYLRFLRIQSKCLRVIGNSSRYTLTTLWILSPFLLSSTNLQPNFFLTAPHTPTPWSN